MKRAFNWRALEGKIWQKKRGRSERRERELGRKQITEEMPFVVKM